VGGCGKPEHRVYIPRFVDLPTRLYADKPLPMKNGDIRCRKVCALNGIVATCAHGQKAPAVGVVDRYDQH
jgi:hypothetical protein